MALLCGLRRFAGAFKTSTLPAVLPKICTSLSGRGVTGFHTTVSNRDLMEFFDDEKNWGENEVKVGRAWKVEELRIKSNSDLHKLWYILLKERNMLYTMEQECKDQCELFPSPERIDKVQESMNNLETVVRERNRAYFELETGETGERESVTTTNLIGYPYTYKKAEHFIPKAVNASYRKKYPQHGYGRDVDKFLMFLKEKQLRKSKHYKRCDQIAVMRILRYFPHVDKELLKERYPEADIEQAMEDPRSRGHHLYNTN